MDFAAGVFDGKSGLGPSGVHKRELRGKSEVPPCASTKHSSSGAERVPLQGQNAPTVPVLYIFIETDASCRANERAIPSQFATF